MAGDDPTNTRTLEVPNDLETRNERRFVSGSHGLV